LIVKGESTSDKKCDIKGEQIFFLAMAINIWRKKPNWTDVSEWIAICVKHKAVKMANKGKVNINWLIFFAAVTSTC
jgi:hypothetical protein